MRLLIALSRPAVIVLLGLFTVTGVVQAHGAADPATLGVALVAVLGFLLCSVVVNDLADEAIDRVNLPEDRGRPLVAGDATRRELVALAATSAIIAVAAGCWLSWRAGVTVVAGLGLSAAYSLRPVRLADRGAVASLLLPAGYVAVPYLVGIFSERATPRAPDLLVLGGLYIGFIGRIVLKDFRDVRGDALFGKRTFLVRHGRRATCLFSAACWVAGAAVVPALRGATVELAAAYGAATAAALTLLAALSTEQSPRRDEALVAAIALVGRGTIVTIIGHLSMTDASWSAWPYRVAMLAFTAVTLGQVATMAQRGPITRLTVPTDLVPLRSYAGGAHRHLARNARSAGTGRRSSPDHESVPPSGIGRPESRQSTAA